MICFEDVTLYLNQRKVLENVSFSIPQGESILLVGNSGAGKSTILKLILGLIKPTFGTIWIRDQKINDLSEKQLLKVRQTFGFVFQEGALFDSLTVEDNVGFFLKENLKLPELQVKKQVRERLKFLGLEEFAHYYPASLSGGMKKRVAVARAVVANPQAMLYDEPTAGLDPVTARKVVHLISDLQKKLKMTSLIVTHEIQHFVKKIQRMIMLKNGRIVYDGKPTADIHEWYEDSRYNKLAV